MTIAEKDMLAQLGEVISQGEFKTEIALPAGLFAALVPGGHVMAVTATDAAQIAGTARLSIAIAEPACRRLDSCWQPGRCCYTVRANPRRGIAGSDRPAGGRT